MALLLGQGLEVADGRHRSAASGRRLIVLLVDHSAFLSPVGHQYRGLRDFGTQRCTCDRARGLEA